MMPSVILGLPKREQRRFVMALIPKDVLAALAQFKTVARIEWVIPR